MENAPRPPLGPRQGAVVLALLYAARAYPDATCPKHGSVAAQQVPHFRGARCAITCLNVVEIRIVEPTDVTEEVERLTPALRGVFDSARVVLMNMLSTATFADLAHTGDDPAAGGPSPN